MLREDMIACARLIERALTLCEFGHAADAVPSLRDAQALLEKAPDEQRQRWRERKKRQRSRDVPVTSPDVPVTSCDVSGDSVVVEEVEEAAAEGARRIPIPPVEASPTPEMVAARVSETIREKSGGLPVSTAPALRAIRALQAVDAGDLPVIEKILQAAEAAAYDELVVRQGSLRKYNVNLVFSPNSSFINAAHAEVTGGLRSKAKRTKVIAAAKACDDCRWPNMVCGRHNSAMGGA